MVRNLKSSDDFSRELSFLFHRSIKIRNSGFAIFGAGLLIMIFGLCLWLLSLHLSPSVLDFDIDVPLSFFNSSEGEDKLVVSDFGDAFGGFLTTYSKLLLGIMGLLVVSSTAFKILKGEEIGEIFPMLLIAGAFLIGLSVFTSALGSEETDATSASTVKVIKKYVKHEKYDKLVAYLNDSNWPSGEEVSVNYLKAQLHIKLGKPDVKLTQNVVRAYMSGVLQSNIPVKVRYALEKTALDKSVSPLAIRYEQKRMSKSHNFSKASVNCLKVGSPVTFVGVLFALLGIKIRRRVRFLESN
ncbi:hypothetical protein [Escherichia coli]|uniref:hypothetical protein n=1 Tax=Escherichia coli TaxID=562 RepID=UPI001E444717|nr:hypothetical protein [Escherichia coli]MCE3963661.1 hypothetical protein [Escherichia coli]MCE3978758.1 hypothetical protein [Escherichia coli]MCE3988748.1 hypothetical protein [Escherichia coli]MCE3993866.1 hypothetical protein [Escherichia coli]MCE4008747.1 hypothetical protein [Escherichia coli]